LSLQLSQRIGQHYIKGWPENTVAAPDGLDILVNNAGILRLAEVKDISLEDIALLNVNVRDPIVASKAAIPHLGSEASLPTKFQGGAGLPVYALSKSALTAFSHGLARELGSRDITVNVVQPGSIDTDMAHGPFSETLRSITALGRYGKVEGYREHRGVPGEPESSVHH
jgi:3-oxoacyl-[acyl-carrier protein] reductase